MLSKPATMLLGIIYKKPLNAYEIIKQLNAMNTKWWYNIADSTVYTTLKTLEKKGLITGKIEKVGNMPDRTIYTLTDKGKDEFCSTVRASSLQFDYDTNIFSIAAFFLDIFPAEEQSALLIDRLNILGKIRDGILEQTALLKDNCIPAIHIANMLRMMDLVEAEIKGAKRLLESI